MVHQSSLCYKDSTLRHFIVSSTSVRCAWVINWKSICIALCCCVQFVEIFTEQRSFADCINFLFSIDESFPFTSRNLRWTCSNARYMSTMVSAFLRNGYFEVADNEQGKRLKNSKMWNWKHCWTKMTLKHKNNSSSNWTLVNELFQIGYKRWERFRRTVDGYHTS